AKAKAETAPSEEPGEEIEDVTEAEAPGRASTPPSERRDSRTTPPPPPSRASKRERAAPSVAERAHAREVESLRRGLAKSRSEEGFFGRLRALFVGKKEISADVASSIEEMLLTSDVGVETTALLLERVKQTLSKSELTDADRVWEALRDE